MPDILNTDITESQRYNRKTCNIHQPGKVSDLWVKRLVHHCGFTNPLYPNHRYLKQRWVFPGEQQLLQKLTKNPTIWLLGWVLSKHGKQNSRKTLIFHQSSHLFNKSKICVLGQCRSFRVVKQSPMYNLSGKRFMVVASLELVTFSAAVREMGAVAIRWHLPSLVSLGQDMRNSWLMHPCS